MAKVNVEPDCGNAPKKLFIRDFMIGLANEDTASILDCLADTIYWEQVGHNSINSKADVEHFLKGMPSGSVDKMTLITLLTHGNEGSVNGTMTLMNGKQYGFCHVFTFTSHGKDAKFKRIMSYIIPEKISH